MSSIHDGHRNRLKQRFADYGDQVLDDHQLLELLLFYTIPQGDVNPVAHQLIETFGSFAAVLDATPEQLQQVKGVGPHTAHFLSMLPAVMRRYAMCRSANMEEITSAADAGAYLQPYFFGARNELFYLLCLDARGRVLSCRQMAEGTVERVAYDSRLIVEIALQYRACSVILAHNHVNGIPLPSQTDIDLTLATRPLLQSLGIHLLDHLIFADGDFSSMVETHVLPRDPSLSP
jgi:DNA repair protein RadC